jgi:tRNA-2-methylthio-N6-dimethylallyladenosine synthase
MNVADSQRVASSLENFGYRPAHDAESADVIVLNTCVVRQSAEDRAHGRLSSLRPLKEANPDLIINLMGCIVGVNGDAKLREAYPYVDVFSPPSDPDPLIGHLLQSQGRALELQQTSQRHSFMDADFRLPAQDQSSIVSAYVPVVYGCSHACTFCIIPFRRGPERSRPVGEIASEVRSLAAQGVREITLLGQIVDRYGRDVPDGPNLASLLRILHEIERIDRIRFLTSHPNWMSAELLETVAELPKVCEHIEVPIQAGDNEILHRMKRGYTAEDYRQLVGEIRRRIPGASIATDIIVGFPGETDDQFERTYRILEELQLDVVHTARYSPRPNTVAARKMEDDVPQPVKMRRFRRLEALQEQISAEINRRYLQQSVEVLVEGKRNGRWQGRTRTNKLAFFAESYDHHGQLVDITIKHTGPWSMSGTVSLASASSRAGA